LSRDVFVHVGLPKTGTTYIQEAIWGSLDRLSAAGFFVPGDTHVAQRRAVWDLIGRRLQGSDQPLVTGSWKELTRAVGNARESRVLLSEEFLVNARRRHVRAFVRDLGPARLHVVVTVRDVACALASWWQFEVSQGATWSWSEFLDAVRDVDTGPPTAGVGFWLRYDLRNVLETWSAAVPDENVHVVVLPRTGAPPTRLLELFAEAVGIEPRTLRTPASTSNVSLGATATEVLRRLNREWSARLTEQQHLRLVSHGIKPYLRREHRESIRFPPATHGWLNQYSQELVEHLDSRDFHVVGDPGDLIPRAADLDGVDPDDITDTELLEVAFRALSGFGEHYAAYWWRTRRRPATADLDVDARTRVSSSVRAWMFGLWMRAFQKSDSVPLLASAARRYLRRKRRHASRLPTRHGSGSATGRSGAARSSCRW
jgi:hypothetical protein